MLNCKVVLGVICINLSVNGERMSESLKNQNSTK